MVAADLEAPVFEAEGNAAETPAENARKYARKLREATIAVRLHRAQFGRRRSMNAEQRQKAADAFGADASFVGGSKRLLNDRCDEFRAVINVLRMAREYWVGSTTPYPDAGVRLMRREKVAEFQEQMETFKASLAEAVDGLNAVYQDLVNAAKEQLGELFDASDYPATLTGAWGLEWDFPSVDPPGYLRQLSPELYEQQAALIEARYAEAVNAAEQAFASEFAKLVGGLVDRLTPAEVVLWAYEGPVTADEAVEQLEHVHGDLHAATEALEAYNGPEGGDAEIRADVERLAAQRDKLLEYQLLAGVTEIQQRDGTVSYRTADGKTVRRPMGDPATAAGYLTTNGCVQAGTTTERRRMTAAAVANLDDFFTRFREMSIGSNAELDALISQAQQAMAGQNSDGLRVAPDELRDNIRDTMAQIAQRLEGMVVAAGGRDIDFEE